MSSDQLFNPGAIDGLVNDAESLVDICRLRAALHPQLSVYKFMDNGEDVSSTLTYAELDNAAKHVAAKLQHSGFQGERALLLYPAGLDYIIAFFACLYAGCIAVPAYPPTNNRHLGRLRAILSNSRAGIILSTGAVRNSVNKFNGTEAVLPPVQWLVTDDKDDREGLQYMPFTPKAGDLAFLQYTSGSTGDAKGVMVSHGNIMANQQLIRQRFGHDENATVVGWLPLYHDMGLIGNVMQPLYCGATAILMPPMAFLEKPLRWLQAISGHQGRTSGGPNFAYDLCVQKINPAERAGLDLSTWKLAFNGAEPVNSETIKRFYRYFAGCGFKRQAFYPCYGLAEATLLATGAEERSELNILSFDKAALEQGNATVTAAAAWNSRELVGCGQAGTAEQLRIANPDTGMECDAGVIGEILLGGAGITQGYWDNAEATANAFFTDAAGCRWLRTGDLGFVAHGELFVCGRLKDLIIIRGRNYYPQDLESVAANASEALNPGGCVAFTTDTENGESLVILAELKRSGLRLQDFGPVIAAIRSAVAEECGVQISRIGLLKPGALLKTSSGKLRRSACREAFLTHSFDRVALEEAAGGTLCSESAEALDAGQQLLRSALSSMNTADAANLVAQQLAAKVAQLSGVGQNRVDLEQPLVALGLDSLKIVEIKNFLDSLLAVDMPLSFLLADSSLRECAALAAELVNGQANFGSVDRAPQSSGNAGQTALSLGQKALWTQTALQAAGGLYRMPVAFKLKGVLKLDALEQSIAALGDRHPVLRSGFAMDAGKNPVCLPEVTARLALRLVNSSDDSRRQEELAAFLAEPMDLQHGPLFKAGLFSCGTEDPMLALCAHHLLVDFRSFVVLMADLEALYRHFAGLSELPAPPRARYSDFVAWQQTYLAGDGAEKDRNYWLDRLAGDLPAIKLPGERVLPASTRQVPGSRLEVLIGADLAGQLKALAGSFNVTLYTLLLAAFKTLMHRYTGEREVLTGTPALGRPNAEFADVAGYFVNPLVLRCQAGPAMPFSQFLKQTGTAVREALSHQHYPYALLQEALRQGQDNAGLFRTWFVLQTGCENRPGLAELALGLPGAEFEWAGMAAVSAALPDQPAVFDLALLMAETREGLSAVWEYRGDILDTVMVRRMQAHYLSLLSAIIENPHRHLGLLPLIPAAELAALNAGNQTSADYGSQGDVIDLFEAIAETKPQATALLFNGEAAGYGSLNRQANRLAHYLISQGISAEHKVGVCLPRSMHWVTAILAILKAGAVYVPVDPDYPAERQGYMLDDAGVTLILTSAEISAGSQLPGVRRIIIDGSGPDLAAFSPENPTIRRYLQQAAYVIYTSGSTGRPKGVTVSHANLRHSTLARVQYYRHTPECYLLLPSFAFDSSVAGIFWTLTQGGCLCLPEDGLLKDAAGLGALIARHHVSHLLGLPSLYQILLDLVPVDSLRSLKTVIVAGEGCPAQLCAQHESMLPGTLFYNEYGPTEASVWATVYRPGREQPESAVLPIGKAIANTRLYVVDAWLQPVPCGVEGELLIGGQGISRGYLGQPGMTAERFIPDSFGEPGARLYCTGDKVRLLEDGNLEFLGRTDRQVKIRGYRIELDEIEARLIQCSGVKAAAVTVREDVPGFKRLTAYWSGNAELDSLKAALKSNLPEFMQPSAWVYLDSMPVNANGKIDRKALPEPAQDVFAGREYAAPRDEAEEAVAKIWQDVLGVERLGIHDDFFELGGHSLAGVQVMAKVQELFAIDLPVSVLFEAATVAEFVDRMAELQSED